MRTRKNAVSIPTKIAIKAETEERRKTRIGLSTVAPDDPLPHSSQADITRRLDAVYTEEAEPLDPALAAAQAEVLPPERGR